MKPTTASELRQAARRASKVATLGLAGIVAATSLVGGLQLAGGPPVARANTLAANHLPVPQRPLPLPVRCAALALSVLNDEHQMATRLVQGETVTVSVTCAITGIPDGTAAQITFGGVTLGTVMLGSSATFTMPSSVPGGRQQTFTATDGSLQATFPVWYDYAPQ